MTITLLSGPFTHYIKNLIENNLEAFGEAFTQVIENDDESLISDAIAYLIENNQSVFTQILADMITQNIDNHFSQSIADLIENYHNQFEASLTPALEGTGPISFTDFTNRSYWTPIVSEYWNITWPGDGAIRLAVDVASQSSYSYSSCGLRFRPYMIRDASTKRWIVRLKVTNIDPGNPTSPGSSDRHLIGVAVTTTDSAYLFGVGRNGNVISGITGSILYRDGAIPNTSLGVSTGITSELVGNVWEVKVTYDEDSSDRGKVTGAVRVDNGDWIDMTANAAAYYSSTQVDGIRIGLMGAVYQNMYPNFGGTIIEFSIDEGGFVSY